MTPDDLHNLIRDGETADVAFAGSDEERLLEAVVALANRPGGADGRILFGVEPDGRITGAGNPELVQAVLARRTRPSLRCAMACVVLPDGKMVAGFTVPASPVPVGTDAGAYLRRGLAANGRPLNRPFFYHEMQARQADRALLDFTALPVPEAVWEDLDPLEFERFRRSIRESRGRGEDSLLTLSPLDLARSLGAVETRDGRTEIRVLGLLLFGTEDALRRFLPAHEAAFQELDGTEVKANDFFRWPLLRLLDELLQRARARHREAEVLVAGRRIAAAHLPERAFREALANAFIHRDYNRAGAVHVQWLGNAVRISNPGGFPEGVRLDNLLVTAPKPRNPLLAEAFKRAGLVERTSRGIDLIFEDELRAGHPLPSYARSTPVDVVLDLPAGEPDLDFVRMTATAEAQAGTTRFGVNEFLLLHILSRQARLTVAEAATLTQLPEIEATAALERLAAHGLLAGRGDGDRAVYHLSPRGAAELRQPPPVLHADEPGAEVKLEQILDHVRREGRIKREDVSALCTVTPRQASYLLDKLVLAGKLVREGERRGVCYRLPAG